MTDLGYYAAKIEECRRLLESSPDQIYRDVYQAMADEFAEKYAALRRRSSELVAAPPPPSPLLHRAAPQALPESAVPSEDGIAARLAGRRVPRPDGRRRNGDATPGLRPV